MGTTGGMFFCVQNIADRGTYGTRLDLLQAVWRWRYLKTGIGADEVTRDAKAPRSSLDRSTALGPYTLLLAAILAGNDKQFEESRKWAERGLAQADEQETPVRIALSVVRAEALVALNKAGEALTALATIEAKIPNHRLIPYRGKKLHFLPKAEVQMTKAFVLSTLGRSRDAMEAGYKAVAILQSSRLLERIGDDHFNRLLGARVAPLQQHALEAERRRFERRAVEYFGDHSPRGIQEEYGQALAVKVAIEDALNSGDHDKYLNAQRQAENLLLETLQQPREIQFADDARHSAYSRLVSLQKEVADLKDQLAQRKQKQNTGQRHQELSTELRKMKAKLAKFVRQLKRSYPDIAARWGRAPTDVGQLQDRLDAKTGIVQYLLLGRESYAFVIHRNGFEITRLRINGRDVRLSCPREGAAPDCLGLTRTVHRYRALLRRTGAAARKSADELAYLGKTLSDLLLGSLIEHIRGLEHLVIVPNNILHRLPWAALPWEGRFLIEDKTLSVLPASSMFGALLTPPDQKPAGVLALGNSIPLHGSWSDLQSAETEVKLLGRHFPGLSPKRILTGADASIHTVVGQDLRGYILHFAAHAQSGVVHRTRLLLSDGDLTYDQILSLNVKNAPLVVLSGCETGLGELLSGDQVYSLADAFLLAEARSVVYSLWLVDDVSTTKLMDEFYRRYGSSGNNATALASAQRTMIKKGYPPRHWAGFLVSEWASTSGISE